MMSADKKLYELIDELNKFVENCPTGYVRIGVGRCLSVCPIGWPDLGDFCVKNDFIDFPPFVWTAGDGVIASGKDSITDT